MPSSLLKRERSRVRRPASRPSVAFVVPSAWPLFTQQGTGGIGGAELRALTFADGLAERSFVVHFLLAQAPCPATDVRGIRLHTRETLSGQSLRQHSRLATWERHVYRVTRPVKRVARSLAGRLLHVPGCDEVVDRIPAETLLLFGVRNDTAALVRAANRCGKRSIVFVTTDRTLADMRRHGRRDRGAYGELGWCVRYALSHASQVVAQTSHQRRHLALQLHRPVQQIDNPFPLSYPPANGTRRSNDRSIRSPHGPFVLWVGRADTFSKRADLCLAVARKLPAIPFLLVMNPQQQNVYDALLRDLPINVRVVPRVPPVAMKEYFQQASLLLNTSQTEGFPNTFLEAASAGVPIVSWRVDPDGMLGRHGCGRVAGGCLTRVGQLVESLWRQPMLRDQIGRRARQYVRERHDRDASCARLATLLCEQSVRRRGEVV